MKEKAEWMKNQILYDINDCIAYRKMQMIGQLIGKQYKKGIQYPKGYTVLDVMDTNRDIAKNIENGNAYWAGRYGQTEMNMIIAILENRFRKSRDRREQALKQFCFNAGFFPEDMNLAERFVDQMITECIALDLHGCWSLYMEKYIVKKYEKDTRLTYLGNLEPWGMHYRFDRKERMFWTTALKGKRVLVIHPFEKTIISQYENHRKQIFQKAYKDAEVLPDFELLTLKAVQSIAGCKDPRFKTWFEALQWMEDECAKLKFDVALIGCGAYGFLLAAAIKKMGKAAIHLGGSTQILFGILGKRWEGNVDFMKNVVNEYWVHPLKEDRVENYMRIEGGCYW